MTLPLPEPTCDMTPDGTFIFELQLPDGRRAVAAVLPEDVDEVAGQAPEGTVPPEVRRRRFQVARLIAEPELQRQVDGTDDAGLLDAADAG